MQASSCRPVGCCLRSFSDRKHSRQAAVHALQCSDDKMARSRRRCPLEHACMADHRLGARERELGWAPRAAMPMAEWISAKVRGRAQVCVVRTAHTCLLSRGPACARVAASPQVAGDRPHPWSWRRSVRRVKTQSPQKWRSRRDG